MAADEAERQHVGAELPGDVGGPQPAPPAKVATRIGFCGSPFWNCSTSATRSRAGLGAKNRIITA
jgi:hypothetical protein